jgi:hypothetical protein
MFGEVLEVLGVEGHVRQAIGHAFADHHLVPDLAGVLAAAGLNVAETGARRAPSTQQRFLQNGADGLA